MHYHSGSSEARKVVLNFRVSHYVFIPPSSVGVSISIRVNVLMEKKNGSHAFHFLPPYLAVSFLRLCIDTNCTRSPLLLPYPMLFSPLPTWRLRGPGIRSFRPSPRRSLTIVHTASSGALLIWPFRGKHCGRVTCGHWAKYQSWTLLQPSHDLNNNCPCNSLAFSLTLQIRRDDDSLASGFHSTPPGANEDLRSTLATQPPEYFVLARRDTTLAERNVVLGGVLY